MRLCSWLAPLQPADNQARCYSTRSERAESVGEGLRKHRRSAPAAHMQHVLSSISEQQPHSSGRETRRRLCHGSRSRHWAGSWQGCLLLLLCVCGGGGGRGRCGINSSVGLATAFSLDHGSDARVEPARRTPFKHFSQTSIPERKKSVLGRIVMPCLPILAPVVAAWGACKARWVEFQDELSSIAAYIYEQMDALVSNRDPRDFDSLTPRPSSTR